MNNASKKSMRFNTKRLSETLASHGLLNWVPDRKYLSIIYEKKIGKQINLTDPKGFNEKLQWLKLHDKNPEYINYVDKYEVRKYIEKMLGTEYLVPLLGVYNSVDEIDWKSLPQTFVLKCTHGSGFNIVCKDKNLLNIEEAKKQLKRWMKKNYFYVGREWPYKFIEPRIVCEQFLTDDSGYELKDYKFMCFNGKTEFLFICLNRSAETGLCVDFYDLDWNLLPFQRHYPNSSTHLEKPHNFDKMIQIADMLSKNMPFVRIDLYEANGNVYFGEITLYPGSGFEEFQPEVYDEWVGNMIKLPDTKIRAEKE